MKRNLLPSLCILLSSCALFHHPFRPIHASPEEAAQVNFPPEIPSEGRLIVRGAVAAAIELAMDDFLPRDLTPPLGATPEELCLHRRESYDVFTAPGPDGVMFVSISLSFEACKMSGPTLDLETTYAIDVRTWRILATKR